MRSSSLGASIAINGDLGSGKSTVAAELAERLSLRRVSVGAIYRELAATRGMTTLELNRHAKLDDEIDDYIDGLQRDIINSGEQAIIDSRLAWHFFPSAFKVHLIADPEVAASRVMARSSATESYASLAETRVHLQERSENERARFLSRYGADKNRLRNYDVVCDTTNLSPVQAADQILDVYSNTTRQHHSDPVLVLNPDRIYPSEAIRCLRDPEASPDVEDRNTFREISLRLSVGYADSCFYVLHGHRELSSAIQRGLKIVHASLTAEGGETVVGGLNAADYFHSETTLTKVYDWEAVHNISLKLPPHLSV